MTPLPENATLIASDGVTWPVKVAHGPEATVIGQGWPAFRDHYGRGIIDSLVIAYDGDGVLMVTVFDFTSGCVRHGARKMEYSTPVKSLPITDSQIQCSQLRLQGKATLCGYQFFT